MNSMSVEGLFPMTPLPGAPPHLLQLLMQHHLRQVAPHLPSDHLAAGLLRRALDRYRIVPNLQGEGSNRRAEHTEEEKEIQARSSAGSQ
jgi:hypothetical protein